MTAALPFARIVSTWSTLEPAIDHDVVELLTTARASVKLALVSNATARLESDLERNGLAELADVVVNTSRIGAKPDRRVYAIAAEQAERERCLFVDDTLANVVAARSFRMTAVHYREIDDLRAGLAALVG